MRQIGKEEEGEEVKDKSIDQHREEGRWEEEEAHWPNCFHLLPSEGFLFSHPSLLFTVYCQSTLLELLGCFLIQHVFEIFKTLKSHL